MTARLGFWTLYGGGHDRAASSTEAPLYTRCRHSWSKDLSSATLTTTSTLVCASTQSSVCGQAKARNQHIREATRTSCLDTTPCGRLQQLGRAGCLGQLEMLEIAGSRFRHCDREIQLDEDVSQLPFTACLLWEECCAHRALLGCPVPKSLAVTLVNVHCLVAEASAPCIVVDVTHDLCLYLHGPALNSHRD